MDSPPIFSETEEAEGVLADRPRRVPGEIIVDRDLIEQAVKDLNKLYAERSLDLVLAIGQYLLDHFFAGDFSAFRSRSRRHISFRRLAERRDMEVPASILYRSVAILEQFGQLPEPVARQLTLTHHRTLLAITDLGQKAALASLAVSQGMTSRQLEVAVQQIGRQHSRGPRGGRRHLPVLVKGLRRLGRELDERGLQDLGVDGLMEYFTVPELERLATCIEAHLALLGEALLRHRLQTAAAEVRDAEA